MENFTVPTFSHTHSFGAIRDSVNSDPACFEPDDAVDGEYTNCGSPGAGDKISDTSTQVTVNVDDTETQVDYSSVSTIGPLAERCLCFKKRDSSLACTGTYIVTNFDCGFQTSIPINDDNAIIVKSGGDTITFVNSAGTDIKE